MFKILVLVKWIIEEWYLKDMCNKVIMRIDLMNLGIGGLNLKI